MVESPFLFSAWSETVSSETVSIEALEHNQLHLDQAAHKERTRTALSRFFAPFYETL